MYSSIGKGLVMLAAVGYCTFSIADEPPPATLMLATSLALQPAKCITLTQGRNCYATVTLTWQTEQQGDYCVYSPSTNRMIQCWQDQRHDITVFEFQAKENVQYQLINAGDQQVLATAVIEVSWVHKASPRKRRWRLF